MAEWRGEDEDAATTGQSRTNLAACLVDMAKADALDLLGETRQSLDLMDRHVPPLSVIRGQLFRNCQAEDNRYGVAHFWLPRFFDQVN